MRFRRRIRMIGPASALQALAQVARVEIDREALHRGYFKLRNH